MNGAGGEGAINLASTANHIRFESLNYIIWPVHGLQNHFMAGILRNKGEKHPLFSRTIISAYPCQEGASDALHPSCLRHPRIFCYNAIVR